MSDQVAPHELRAMARRTRMPSSCRQVFDALLDHRGRNATAWVANSTLQAETGLDETTVRRACRALERTGWLIAVDDGRRVNEYQLAAGTPIETLLVRRAKSVDADAPLTGHGCPPAPVPPQPGTYAPHGGHACAPQGGHVCPPNYSYELSSELVPPIVPPPGDTGTPTPEPTTQPPSQPELLTPPAPPTPAPTPATPEPKRRPSKPKPLPPEQDPTWSAFAALAVESGHVTQPPKAEAKTYRKGKNRAQVLAELAAEHGADEVLAVWRHTLTSQRETPQWWRKTLQGPALVDAFLAGTAYAKLTNDLEAVRDAERKAQRPRLALVPKAVEATDPVGAFRAVCAALGDDMATAAKIAAMVPDPALRFDVLALAASLGSTVPLGFSFGRTWTDQALLQRLPEARVRWQAHLDARQAERAPLQVAQ